MNKLTNYFVNKYLLNEARPRPYRQHPNKRTDEYKRDKSDIGKRHTLSDVDAQELKKHDTYATIFGSIGRPWLTQQTAKYNSIVNGNITPLIDLFINLFNSATNTANNVSIDQSGPDELTLNMNINTDITKFTAQSRNYLKYKIADIFYYALYNVNDGADHISFDVIEKYKDKYPQITNLLQNLGGIPSYNTEAKFIYSDGCTICMSIKFNEISQQLQQITQDATLFSELKQNIQLIYGFYYSYFKDYVIPALQLAIDEVNKLEFDRIYNESFLQRAANYLND